MSPSRAARIIALAALVATSACDSDPRELLPWRTFHATASAMEPTLPRGTRFMAESVEREELVRGDIVILRKNDEDYVMRLAALPGDRIALVNGAVMLDGKEVGQRPAGKRSYFDGFEHREASIMVERFPGERRSHRILDSGFSPGDEMAEIELGPDQFFVLGDNRDNAADSRYSRDVFGLGLIRGEQIRRRVQLD